MTLAAQQSHSLASWLLGDLGAFCSRPILPASLPQTPGLGSGLGSGLGLGLGLGLGSHPLKSITPPPATTSSPHLSKNIFRDSNLNLQTKKPPDTQYPKSPHPLQSHSIQTPFDTPEFRL